MKAKIILSLVLNIVVLVPVTYGVATNAAWVDQAYGAASPARGILLALYLAILAASFVLLFKPVVAAVPALLAIQVLYKWGRLSPPGRLKIRWCSAISQSLLFTW